MGEGTGNDELIIPYISSANIACGFHAGNEDIMKRTVELALKYKVAIGVHPSFNDKENFGRTEMQLSSTELYDVITQQIFMLQKICDSFHTTIHHVKPHGALYNMAAKNESMSFTIAKAIKDVDANFVLYGLSGSHLISEAKKLNLKTANEVFADRTYQDDATLTPRKQPNALINDDSTLLKQVLQMVHQQTVTSINGNQIKIAVETICIHGDGELAFEFAKRIKLTLKEYKIEIKTV